MRSQPDLTLERLAAAGVSTLKTAFRSLIASCSNLGSTLGRLIDDIHLLLREKVRLKFKSLLLRVE